MWRVTLSTGSVILAVVAILLMATVPAAAEPPSPQYIPYCFPPPTADLPSFGIPASEPLPLLPYPADAAGPLCDGRHLGFDKPLQAVPYCPNYRLPTPEEVAKLGRAPVIPGSESPPGESCDARHIGRSQPGEAGPPTRPAPLGEGDVAAPAQPAPAPEPRAPRSDGGSGFPWLAVALGAGAVVLVAATLYGRRRLVRR